MGLVNRLYTFATMPGISPDIGAKIDAELNTLFNMINGGLDDANIDGSPAIQSNKLSLGGAGYLPLAGGNMSGAITHAFEGLWRAMGSSGLIREYRSNAGDNILWGIAYNTYYNGGWQGRDISDICLRIELTKTSDGWGGLRFYSADSLGAGAAPVWNPVQHYEPMGGHSRYNSGGTWSSFVEDVTATTETNKSGVFNFNKLVIPGGITWTLAQGKPLFIYARESVTINGLIDGNQKGGLGGSAGFAGQDGFMGGSGGGAGSDIGDVLGYKGGDSSHLWKINGGTSTSGAGTNGIDSIVCNPAMNISLSGVFGGGGGGGGTSTGAGNGGGYIYIEAPIIIVGASGSIVANGQNGVNAGVNQGSGGGGGGGCVYIRCKSFINNGSGNITAIKGNGGTTGENAGGNGGAGIIYIEERR